MPAKAKKGGSPAKLDLGSGNDTQRSVANDVYNTPRDRTPSPVSSTTLRRMSSHQHGEGRTAPNESAEKRAARDSATPRTGLRRGSNVAQASGGTKAAAISQGRDSSASKPKAGKSGTLDQKRGSIVCKDAPMKRGTGSLQLSSKQKPEWADVQPLAPAKERLDLITAPRRSADIGSRPGTPQLSGGSRPGTPTGRPTVPVLNLKLGHAQTSEASRDGSGEGSTLQGSSPHALPRLSRTGKLTARSSLGSARVDSLRLGSPRLGTLKNAAAEPEADDSASEQPEAKREKVVIAFGKAIPQEPKRRTNHGGEDDDVRSHGKHAQKFAAAHPNADRPERHTGTGEHRRPPSPRLGQVRGNSETMPDVAPLSRRRSTADTSTNAQSRTPRIGSLRRTDSEATGEIQVASSPADDTVLRHSSRIGTPRGSDYRPSSSVRRSNSLLLPGAAKALRQDEEAAGSPRIGALRGSGEPASSAALPPPVNKVPISMCSPEKVHKRKVFLSRPGPTTAPVQCTIVRDTSTSKVYPTYSLYLDDPSELIMAARKRKKSKSANYIISVDDQDLFKGTYGFCGKVRSNFVGTQFVVSDSGLSQGVAKLGEPEVCDEVAMVRYQTNVLGTRGPRRMTVILPKKGGQLSNSGSSKDGSMTTRLKQPDAEENLLILRNRAPKWNNQLGAYCLNFGGRVTLASVKNFQLVEEDEDHDKANVILQFGKIARDKFSMDFQAPMSALQAFAICLTSFDSKLACE